MNEELYQPLPSVEAYLARIGLGGAKEPTREYLDELIYAHQRAVPFDDLDVSDLAMVPSLGVADLFDKIVVRRRGGYCFELNGLFGALLRALGFDVQPCMARVIFRPGAHPLITHRANIVTIDGARYLADVGFGGPMPTFAPIIQSGATRSALGHTFTLHECDEYWWEVGYVGSSAQEQRVLRFCTMPVEEHDFIPLSFYQSANPQSVFRQHRMVNIKTPDGAYDLRDNVFTTFAGGEKTSVELQGDEELDRILAEKFGIVDWR